jgi:hypothetical protein
MLTEHYVFCKTPSQPQRWHFKKCERCVSYPAEKNHHLQKRTTILQA